MNCDVDCAANGHQAVSAFNSVLYDIIYMDCHMPEMNGIEATREIRRIENNTRHTVIIALTADVTEKNKRETKEAGMDDFIAKPVTQEQLKESIEKWTTLQRNSHSAMEKKMMDEKYFDNERLNELLSLDDMELMKELVTIYFRESEQGLRQIEQAIASHDGSALRGYAHKLKGGSASLGVKNVKELCLQLEKKGEHNDFTETKELLNKLLPEYATAKKLLTERFLV
jgi:CheY-like chemotaxis protein/HPt (histidine-containing phosphotransfer) domain-containing protein